MWLVSRQERGGARGVACSLGRAVGKAELHGRESGCLHGEGTATKRRGGEGPVQRQWLHRPTGSLGSDENQNRLGEREEEEGGGGGGSDRLLPGGRALCQQDSVNNNEETDNRPCPRNLDPERTGEAYSRDTGVPGVCPSLRPMDDPQPPGRQSGRTPHSTSARGPSSLVASLQEDIDHAQLPQRLHQIAEAYFLEEDYERALQFVQLERLYHERLLSNLAALQEQWESRLNANRQHKSRPREWAHTDLGSAYLETLSRICRTHQRPSLSVEKCTAVDKSLTNSLICWTRTEEETSNSTSLPCSTHSSTESARLMEEQLAVGEVPPAQGVADEGDDDASTPGHPRAPICNSDSSPPRGHTHLSRVRQPELRRRCVRGGGEGGDAGSGDLHGDPPIDSFSSAGAGPTAPLLETPTPAANTLTEEAADDRQAGAEPTGAGPEEREAGEEGLGVDAVTATATGASSLDALAKQIKVEEIAPAPGLVSILKRRSSLEGAPPHPPAPPKQAPKRKVRFQEPDDGADQEEVAGDSWLLLLLLCMVTMVISVGGTALYCTFGDARSSVCSDFSRNVDFCFSQVQRGVDELRHWLSPGS
ncbi:hypothetical protein AAFF_G00069540 [Aldrovandia affinis]|uniref:Consortin C-terminal domain-containing protein n=1 Tax=Aldrovandia affinis TaxID=143900 RepID=A0AAD7RZK0_9TELE|nr:hypothetical protein AAFF_G00069540 [Aldrovandia affinis]